MKAQCDLLFQFAGHRMQGGLFIEVREYTRVGSRGPRRPFGEVLQGYLCSLSGTGKMYKSKASKADSTRSTSPCRDVSYEMSGISVLGTRVSMPIEHKSKTMQQDPTCKSESIASRWSVCSICSCFEWRMRVGSDGL